jgi:hypothetical protein
MEIMAPACLPYDQIDPLAGTEIDDSSFDVLVSGGRVLTRTDTSAPHANIAVRKPDDGSLLCLYRHNLLPRGRCQAAYDVLSSGKVKFGSRNRGLAAGPVDGAGGVQEHPVKTDGTISRTAYAALTRSAVLGYLDRTPRLRACRATPFNAEHPEAFQRLRPFVEGIDRAFAEAVPGRYAAQRAAIQETHPAFRLWQTVFSSVTVNDTWSTHVHKDNGDYAQGMGVLSVLDAGHYTGGYLVFPKYRVAIDMRTGSVLLADVHEWHANTNIVGEPGRHRRLSMVFYLRTGMRACGSPAEEVERAKHLLDARTSALR